MSTGAENANTNPHSEALSGRIPKILLNNGMYKITQWSDKLRIIAPISHMFLHGGIWMRDPSSESALSALSISIVTNTDRDSVLALTLPSVKYEHGLSLKSKVSKLLTLKPSQVGHSDQFRS